MPLLSSIVGKKGTRKENPRQRRDEKRNMIWFLAGSGGDIYGRESIVPLQ
jgi:hypothetical protein